MNLLHQKIGFLLLFSVCNMPIQANIVQSSKNQINKLIAPTPDTDIFNVKVSALSHFELDTQKIDELDLASPQYAKKQQNLTLNEAILVAIQRHPDILQSISNLASQSANIDIAKSNYFPQLSGGLKTADLTSTDRDQHLVNFTVRQLVYDFGKIKNSVNIEQARLMAEQANVLVSIDQIAYQVATTIINIQRYQEICRIAQEQVYGVAKIAEITNLRAQAGISSQADPVQALANLESAESNLIVQQTQLRQQQQRLRTLLGFETKQSKWDIPERIIQQSNLYTKPIFNEIPAIMAAYAEIQVAKFRKEEARLTPYPTVNLLGSVNLNTSNLRKNNNADNYVMLEVNSNLYQGGAVQSQLRAATYAEEAAKARVNSTYLDVLDETRILKEEIDNKQRQLLLLLQRKKTTIRTKELYQEQYKLGTRTAVDLLNAEQAIHSAAQEIENTRFDIYAAISRYIFITGRTRDVYDLNHISIQGFQVQP